MKMRMEIWGESPPIISLPLKLLRGFIENDDEEEGFEDEDEDDDGYIVAHESLSSSSESDGDEEDSTFSEDLDEEAGEHLEFSEEEEEFEDHQHSRSGYQITQPSRSEQKKHSLSAKSGGVFHEKKIKVSHTSHSSRGERNEEMILETIEVDIPVMGKVTVVESSEEEAGHHQRPKHSKRAKGGKKKNLRASGGKRVIIHDTSSEEEADLWHFQSPDQEKTANRSEERCLC